MIAEMLGAAVIAVASFTIGRLCERSKERASLMSVADEQRLRAQLHRDRLCVWDASAIKSGNR